jgi:hypothetical protein
LVPQNQGLQVRDVDDELDQAVWKTLDEIFEKVPAEFQPDALRLVRGLLLRFSATPLRSPPSEFQPHTVALTAG